MFRKTRMLSLPGEIPKKETCMGDEQTGVEARHILRKTRSDGEKHSIKVETFHRSKYTEDSGMLTNLCRDSSFIKSDDRNGLQELRQSEGDISNNDGDAMQRVKGASLKAINSHSKTSEDDKVQANPDTLDAHRRPSEGSIFTDKPVSDLLTRRIVSKSRSYSDGFVSSSEFVKPKSRLGRLSIDSVQSNDAKQFARKFNLRNKICNSIFKKKLAQRTHDTVFNDTEIKIVVDTPWLNGVNGKQGKERGSNSAMNKHHALTRTLALLPQDGRFVWGPTLQKNENIYRGLLRSLLHPLGVPDTKVGLRPGDLVDRLRQVFEVEREDHEFYIRDELPHRPRSLQVNIIVMECQGLQNPNPLTELFETYCLVSIVHPLLKTLKTSPGTSPRHSPRLSPKFKKHSTGSLSPGSPHGSSGGSQEWEDVLRTQTVKHSSSPQFNEEFQLAIEDFFTDEIHIFLCNHEDENTGENKHPPSHHHGLKHMFKSLLHMNDHERVDSSCLGKIIIPIRDIPSQGCDWWLDLSVPGKSSKSIPGRCHLKITISHRQEDYLHGEYFSVEDYYQAAQHIYKYNLEKSQENGNSMDHSINTQDRRILDSFSISHGISNLSQSLMHVIVLLEWSATQDDIAHTQALLNKSIQELQMIWVSKQIANISQKMPISDAEIMMYRKAATNYINCVTDHLEDMTDLFPPSVDAVNDLKGKLGVTLLLLELDLWETKTSPHKELMCKVLHKLQDDVAGWTSESVSAITKHDVVQDSVIPELSSFIEVVNMAASHCNAIGMVTKFYNSIGIGYYRVVSFAVEKKISEKMRELMIEMDKYQRRYHNFVVNIAASSRLSLRAFFAVRKFYAITRDNVTRRDVFRLKISQYQQWFQEALVFWLQTFRSECMTRIGRALEIDKDVVVAASLVKFSNSSVDVLSCFAKITEEWRQIDFHDPDLSLMGITKITDLICDGARTYTEKIHLILERNGYYDDSEEQFDVTDRLCITLNNIEHVRQYLKELPQLLDWDSVALLVSTKHEQEEVGEKALTTLCRLIDTADQEILLKARLLMMQIMERMKVDIGRFMELFTQQAPEKATSLDQLLQYLSTNLRTLHGRLMSAIYPRVIEQLWTTVVSLFDEQLKVGERPEYYAQMKQHLRALKTYFKNGLDEEKQESFLFQTLKYRLDLNVMTTEELMLEYYSSLAENISTPTDYLGHLAFKVAYLEETRGNITIFVKVIRASDLPGLDSSGLSDPYVVVSLHPKSMFGHSKAQKTKVMEQTLNPVFNTTFQFPNVPKEYLSVKGAVLVLSVLDRDHIGHDDFAGEIILNLSSIPAIKMSETVDSRPVMMLSVKRPEAVFKGAYQVVRERIPWDKSAKFFIQERQKFIEGQRERTDKPSVVHNLFSFFSSKRS